MKWVKLWKDLQIKKIGNKYDDQLAELIEEQNELIFERTATLKEKIHGEPQSIEVEDDYDEEYEPEKEATNKKAEEPKEERNTIVHGVVDGLGRYFNAQKEELKYIGRLLSGRNKREEQNDKDEDMDKQRGLFNSISNKVSGVKDTMEGIVDNITRLLSRGIVGFFSGIFKMVFGGLISKLGVLILAPLLYRLHLTWGDIVKKEFDNVSITGEMLAKAIQQLGPYAGAGAGLLVGGLVGGLPGLIIGPIVGYALGWLARQFSTEKVAKFFDEAGEVINADDFVGKFVQKMRGLFGSVKEYFDKKIDEQNAEAWANSPIKSMLENISQSMTNYWTELKTNWAKDWDDTKKQIDNIKERISTTVKEKSEAIKDIFSKMADKIESFFNNIISSIQNNWIYKFLVDRKDPIVSKQGPQIQYDPMGNVIGSETVETKPKLSPQDKFEPLKVPFKVAAAEMAAKMKVEQKSSETLDMLKSIVNTTNVSNRSSTNIVSNSSQSFITNRPSSADSRNLLSNLGM